MTGDKKEERWEGGKGEGEKGQKEERKMSRMKKMKERDTAEEEKEEKDEEKRRIKMEDEKRIRRLGRGIIMIKKVIGEAKNLQNKN